MMHLYLNKTIVQSLSLVFWLHIKVLIDAPVCMHVQSLKSSKERVAQGAA